ncbi:MAG: hypothetical protein HUJ68_06285 [Clostridia bacterium]|nr:hypothetical protein [Clostridia bacterium]
MKEIIKKLRLITQKRAFHNCIMITTVSVVLFIVGVVMLRYMVEGEKNMPFNLNKIIVISSSDGIDKDNQGNSKWAFDINQNNDFYFYIEKNENFEKQETIKSILIDNIEIERIKEKGEIKYYRPNTLEAGANFANKPENEVEAIEYQGALETNLKTLEISNQGGIIAFRCANNGIAEYISDEEEIKHTELLKKSGLSEEELKQKISFDFTIKIESGKEYKAKISIDIPVNGLLEKGTSSIEITNLTDVVFKRTKN